MSRFAQAVLSTAHLLHNMRVISERSPSAKIIAMIKANAYGHGIRSVAKRLEDHTHLFGVASIDEAIILREQGIKKPILLMQGIFEASELRLAAEHDLQIMCHGWQHCRWLEEHYATLGSALCFWLKINTGMGRLGFSLPEAEKAYAFLCAHPGIRAPVRIVSHFACADQLDHPLNELQQQRFADFIQNKATEKSLANSAGIFHFPQSHYDYVRPGLALYGGSPGGNAVPAATYGLKPVMTLHSQIIAIQHFHRGDPIGYGARYICPEDMMVGIVAFGYGDGYPRSAPDGTPVLVEGLECPIVGLVSMDMLAVDLRAVPQARVGSPVVLWGEGLAVERVASACGQSAWDLLAGVQNRVRFVWV